MSSLTGDEPDLKLGDTGEWVVMLQVRLYGLRIFREMPDSSFGMTTENAVRELQSQLGLDNNGEVNRETWEALLHQEQQVGINYQFQSPYDALTQLRYDLDNGGQRDGWGNHYAEDQPDGRSGELSPDGQWQWNGSDWQAADGAAAGSGEQTLGDQGQLSPDGQWQWNGSDWVPADSQPGAGSGATAGAGSAAASEYAGQLSDDGQWRWDGTQWQAAEGGSGSGNVGQLSDDGQWRWDGTQWQAA